MKSNSTCSICIALLAVLAFASSPAYVSASGRRRLSQIAAVTGGLGGIRNTTSSFVEGISNSTSNLATAATQLLLDALDGDRQASRLIQDALSGNGAAAKAIRDTLQQSAAGSGTGVGLLGLAGNTTGGGPGLLLGLTDPITALFGESLALTNLSGLAPLSDLSANFQELLSQQADFYQNAQRNLLSGNGSFAVRTVCDLAALYTSGRDALLPAGVSPALSALVSNATAAQLLNDQCQDVPLSQGPLLPAADGLFRSFNNTLRDQVARLASLYGDGGGRSSLIPRYLQSSNVGTLLGAISGGREQQQAGGGGLFGLSSSSLASDLYNGLIRSLGSSSDRNTGSGILGIGRSPAVGLGRGAGLGQSVVEAANRRSPQEASRGGGTSALLSAFMDGYQSALNPQP